MINRSVFYARKSICERCEFWSGRCTKGHILHSPVGCPIRSFPPVQGAGVMIDTSEARAGVAPCVDCTAPDGLKPMRWPEALEQFGWAMAKWKSSGKPLVDDEAHSKRVEICKHCPGGHYRVFQCKLCKCVVFVKAKMATETCPAGYWPVVNA